MEQHLNKRLTLKVLILRSTHGLRSGEVGSVGQFEIQYKNNNNIDNIWYTCIIYWFSRCYKSGLVAEIDLSNYEWFPIL